MIRFILLTILLFIHNVAFCNDNLNNILTTLKSDSFVIKFQVYERNEFESTVEGSNTSIYDWFKGKTITLARVPAETMCAVFDEATGFEYYSLDNPEYHCNFYVKDGVFYDSNQDVDFINIFPEDLKKIMKKKNIITKMKNVPNTSLFDMYLGQLSKNFSAIITEHKYININGDKVKIDFCDVPNGGGYEYIDNTKLNFVEFRTPLEYTPIEISRYYFNENKFVKFVKIQDYKQFAKDVAVGGVKIIEFDVFSKEVTNKKYVFPHYVKFKEVRGYI